MWKQKPCTGLFAFDMYTLLSLTNLLQWIAALLERTYKRKRPNHCPNTVYSTPQTWP